MNIEELLDKLKKAPQDKEGGFKVSTWKMVIEEIIKLKDLLDNTKTEVTKKIEEAKLNQDTIKKEIKDDFSKDEAKKILF